MGPTAMVGFDETVISPARRRRRRRFATAVVDVASGQILVDAGGLELLGPDGVLAEFTKRLLERCLSEELTEHLGFEPGDPAGRGSGNNRNGTTPRRC